MADRVVLHVGTMKSGTTYLQRRLEAGKAALADRGVLVPGTGWRSQVLAVGELVGRRRRVAEADGAWDALAAEIREHHGAAVLSMEFLGQAGPAAIERALTSLGDAEVTVVLTVRDLNRAVPAMWQESLKNYRTTSFAEYVAMVRTREDLGARFWREQGAAHIAGMWARRVGADSVAVVTVPHPGAERDLLWQRFCAAGDLPADVVADAPPVNESLGAASAQVLRRVNALLAEAEPAVAWPDYVTAVKQRLAKQILAGHRPEEEPIGFDVPGWVRRRSRRIRDRITELGPRVVGDLAELEPVAVPGVDPAQVTAAEQLAAARYAWQRLYRCDLDEPPPAPALPAGDGTAEGDLDAAVAALVTELRDQIDRRRNVSGG